jgi:sugar-specific transcriptional regulator TrmB
MTPYRSELERIGLSTGEAEIYLALLHHGPLVAAAIARETGIPRTGVYRTLDSLADKGLIEGGLALGSKFAAVSPEEALPALIVREQQALSEHKQIADKLVEALGPVVAADAEGALDDTVQVLRTPQVIYERWQRFQIETERIIEAFVKAPIISTRGNPAQKKARKRGVQYQIVYERAVIEDPLVKPHIAEWVAGGEQARVFDGELPYKLSVFDRELVMLTLARRSGSPSAMFIRHAPFAKSMGLLFDYFWQQGKPLTEYSDSIVGLSKASAKLLSETNHPSLRISRNGRRAQSAKKEKA